MGTRPVRENTGENALKMSSLWLAENGFPAHSLACQLLSLCSHSVPDHTFGSRCARRGGRLRHSRQTPLPTCTEREQPQCQLPALRHVWGRISIFHGAQTCSCWMHREPPAADLLADSRRLCLCSAGRPVLPGGQDVAPTGQHLHSQGLLLRALRVQPRCSAPG